MINHQLAAECYFLTILVKLIMFQSELEVALASTYDYQNSAI